MNTSSKLLHISKWLQENGLVDELYESIQQEDAFTRITTGICGWRWEDRFRHEAEDRGLTWDEAPSKNLPWDGRVNGKKIQCKSTSYTRRIDIRSKKKANKRRYLAEDFDVLALRILKPKQSEYFFVPTTKMTQNGLLPCSILLEDYQDCKDNWECFKMES